MVVIWGRLGEAGSNSVPGLWKDPNSATWPRQCHGRALQPAWGAGGRGMEVRRNAVTPRPALGQCHVPGAVCEGTEPGWAKPEASDLLEVFPSSPGSSRAAKKPVQIRTGQQEGRGWGEGWPQGIFFYFRWKYGSRLLIFTLCAVTVYIILAARWLVVNFWHLTE